MKLTWLTNIFQQRILTGTHTQYSRSSKSPLPSAHANENAKLGHQWLFWWLYCCVLVYEGFSVELGNNNSGKVSTIYLLSSVHCIRVRTYIYTQCICAALDTRDAMRSAMRRSRRRGRWNNDRWMDTGQEELEDSNWTRDCLCSPLPTHCETPPELSQSQLQTFGIEFIIYLNI